MRSNHVVAVLLIALLLTGTAAAYKGKQLNREPIEDVVLTDQNGETYTFATDARGVVVVSFIFTQCPDVCPVLTQSLIEVESALTEDERADVTFVSISVDPKRDTPDVLKEYSERMGASWPHLTGTQEELQPVWDAFALVVHHRLIERGDVLCEYDLSRAFESHHGVDVGRLFDHRGVIEVGGLWGHAGFFHFGCAFDKSLGAVAS